MPVTFPNMSAIALTELTRFRIWLRDVASILVSQKPDPSRPYYLHGFDISGAQFQSIPTERNTEIHMSEQDCLKPFPAEHHDRYDFVHMRFLAGALKTEEFGAAVKNLFDLLSMSPSIISIPLLDAR